MSPVADNDSNAVISLDLSLNWTALENITSTKIKNGIVGPEGEGEGEGEGNCCLPCAQDWI